MKGTSKKVYFDMIFMINTITHRTIKMKPIDAKPDFYAEWNVESIEKDPLKLVIM